jgi:autotransporter-associated beta strand protein
VVFAATGASNLSTTLGADYTVSTVTLNTGGITVGGANTLTANTTSALAIRDTATSGTNVISANLAGTGAGLTKSGAGTLTLSGANTFGGGLILSAGTLNLNSATAPGSGTITISGGTLDNTSGFAVTLSNNNTQSWNGDFTFTGTNTLSLGSGAVALGASCTVTVSGGTLGVGGIISGSGYSLTKAGAGTLTLRGANTYTGGTTLSAGTLNINSASAIGSGSFTISGGTLNNTSGSSVTLSTNNALTWNGDFAFTGTNDLNLGNGAVTMAASRQVTVNGGNLTVGGIISGSGLGLAKAGSGTLILGGVNTYTGATTVSGGTLQTSAADRMSDSSAISVSSGATFALGGNETVASIAGAGNYSLGANTLTFGDTSNQTVSGTISGTGALVKSGSGSITLSGSNSYSGGTRINAGTIFVGHNSALGSGTLTFAASGTGLASNDSNDRTISNALGTFAGTSAIYTFGSAGSGNLTFTNTTSAALGSVRTFTVNNSWTSFANAFTGASDGITKAGTGTLILAGNNTYTGATTINAGTLQIGNGGATGSLSTSSAITVNGTLAFNRSDALTQGTNFSSASISGTGSLVQNGTGNLTLNVANTYSGGTILNTGTLNINNASALGSGALTINGGTINSTGITLNNNAQNWYGNFAFTGSNDLNMGTGAVTMNASRTVTVSNGNFTVGGNITGSTFGLTKNGTGTMILTGANTYTGDTTITAGTLTISGAGQLGSGSYSGNISNAGTLNYASTANQTLSGTISGTGALTKNGTGTLTLSHANTYTGNTTINSGTLSVNATNALGATTDVIINEGASMLVAALDGINDAANITMGNNGTLILNGTGEVVGAFSMSHNGTAVIDMGYADSWISFWKFTSALSDNTRLEIWNYTVGSDHVYIREDTNGNVVASLPNVTFYSDLGTNSLGNGFFSAPELHSHIVPEPETYATAALLLIGLGIYAYRRRQSTSSQVS